MVAAAVVIGGLAVALLLLTAPDSNEGPEGGTPEAGVIPLLTITGPGTGSKPQLSRPLGAAFDRRGRVYVSDTGNRRVCVFDRNGKFLFAFDGSKRKEGSSQAGTKLVSPAGIAVAESGDVYVADLQGGRVDVFDSEGTYLRRLPADPKATLSGPTDVDVRAGVVYVTEAYEVLLLTTDGKIVESFGQAGEGRGDLDHPNGIAVSGSGIINVSDSNNSQVKAFRRNGKVRWVYGSEGSGTSPPRPTDPVLPRGLAVMRDGSVLAADAPAHRLLRLSAAGKFVATYGSRGVEPGQFNFPNDVDVQGSRVLVTDKENNRVQVVELQD